LHRTTLQRAASQQYIDSQPALWKEEEVTSKLAKTLGTEVDKAFAAVSNYWRGGWRTTPPAVPRAVEFRLAIRTVLASLCLNVVHAVLTFVYVQAWQDDHRLLVGTKSNHLLQVRTTQRRHLPLGVLRNSRRLSLRLAAAAPA
jgi:hypothetical protein